MGNTREDSALYAGIAYRTLAQWIQRGKALGRGKLAQFVQDVKKAEADAAVGYVGVIKRATLGGQVTERRVITRRDGTVETVEKFAEPQWTAAAWWLQRKRKEFALSNWELSRLRQMVAEGEKEKRKTEEKNGSPQADPQGRATAGRVEAAPDAAAPPRAADLD